MSTVFVPPVLPRFDAAAFRQALVGLSDPARKVSSLDRASMREEAVSFTAMLPELYGFDDRLVMWERIGKALNLACTAVHDNDLARWSGIVLENVGCELWRAASHEGWTSFQTTAELSRPDEWREQFIRYVGQSLATVVPLARARWGEKKELKAAAKPRTRKGGD